VKSLPQIATNAKQHLWPKPNQPDAPENPSELSEACCRADEAETEGNNPKRAAEAANLCRANCCGARKRGLAEMKMLSEATKPNDARRQTTESSLTPNTAVQRRRAQRGHTRRKTGASAGTAC
jgi:hypothetical protein